MSLRSAKLVSLSFGRERPEIGLQINPLNCKSNYSAPPSPLLAVPNVTAHPSTASVPITVLLYEGPLLCGFNVAIKGLSFGFFLWSQPNSEMTQCHDVLETLKAVSHLMQV